MGRGFVPEEGEEGRDEKREEGKEGRAYFHGCQTRDHPQHAA